jgi:hypothetical protein
MRNIMKKFDKCLDTWVDLPQYVYSSEYKKAFIEYIEKKMIVGQKVESTIVIMILHHETEERTPYFNFDRK